MPKLTIDLEDEDDIRTSIVLLNSIASSSGNPYAADKSRQDRVAEVAKAGRDYTKYDVAVGGNLYKRLNKRRSALAIVKHLCDTGIATPERIERTCRHRAPDGRAPVRDSKMFELIDAARTRPSRWFLNAEELIHCKGKTYAFSNQWGRTTIPVIERLKEEFPEQHISATPCC